MAKMKRPVGDLVSGKVGSVVFFTRKNQSFVRAAPQRKETQWTKAASVIGREAEFTLKAGGQKSGRGGTGDVI